MRTAKSGDQGAWGGQAAPFVNMLLADGKKVYTTKLNGALLNSRISRNVSSEPVSISNLFHSDQKSGLVCTW